MYKLLGLKYVLDKENVLEHRNRATAENYHRLLFAVLFRDIKTISMQKTPQNNAYREA